MNFFEKTKKKDNIIKKRRLKWVKIKMLKN